jgi:carbon-monoxide dehydrogenase large subunit
MAGTRVDAVRPATDVMAPSPVHRVEDERFLRGEGRFVANLRRDTAWLAFVRSPVAHARLETVDVSPALAVPGVHGAFAAADIGLPPIHPMVPVVDQSMVRSYLAHDVVRFAGEPVAVVAASSLAIALDAAERIDVRYDALPVVVDVDAALRADVVLHPAAGSNIALSIGPVGDETEPEPDHVTVHLRQRNPRVAIAPIEGRAISAAWDGDRVTVWVSGQGPHPYRDAIAAAFGLAHDDVRVICPDVGGGFGAKAYPYPEEVLTVWVAREIGRPATFVEHRAESMASSGHGRAQLQDITLTGRRDGTLVGVALRVVQDCGAYPMLGAYLPNMTRAVLTGPYRIARSRFTAASVVTNTNPVVAYRGAGQPEAAAVMERAIDRFASEIGLDPVAVRRRNLIAADEFPFTNAAGLVYDSGDYAAGLDLLMDIARYDDTRAEQAARRERGDPKLLGIGVALFVESCSTSNHHEHARVRVAADGSVDVWTGTSPYGQGHATTWAMLVAQELGGSVADIRVHHGDSDWFPTGTVTGGSRSVQVGGVAARRAAHEVRVAAGRHAADLLEASPDDVVYDSVHRRFHVVGTPQIHVSLADVAAAQPGSCLESVLRFDPIGGTCSSGAYLAVVEVDSETGLVTLKRFVAVDDAGVIVNPQLVEGQVHGGVVQGIAQALHEHVVYDEHGTLRTASLADYLMPTSCEAPFIETATIETPSPRNELGAKGIGESGAIGATPAIHNAVVDALAPLGVVHLDLPLTPESVWRAISAVRG